MSLRFVRGRSGSGKTGFIIDEMVEELQKDPAGNPLIYIVPDQMTFLSEQKLVSRPGIEGMFRLQVYSFTRLAWRILQETGGISRLHIQSSGLNMLIRKIINENKDRLRVFQQTADKFGFIDQVEQLFAEFKRYCIMPEEMTWQKEKTDHPALEAKIHDLELIYSLFEKQIQGTYLASEDYLPLLAEKIKDSELLREAEIYIDGFHSFTPQEYMVIEQLLKYTKRVTIVLDTDRDYRNCNPEEYELFRMTGETYATMYQIALDNGIDVEDDVVFEKNVRYQNPSLIHLEEHFNQIEVKEFPEEPDIYFCEAADKRAEIEGIGRKIVSLVRDGGYRYKDIAILVRNGDSYYELFDTIFTDYKIPYYIDQKRPMVNHPLIELIRSTLEIITGFWRHDAVFRAVKTELLFPLNVRREVIREKMDRLENYCLEYGIQGKKWISKERWPYRRYKGLDRDFPQTDDERKIEQEINESRLIISAPVNRLANRLKRAENGRELCAALFLYLEELDVPAKLEKMQLEAEEKGRLVLSREHEQAWNAVIQLMDQYVEILGEEKVTVKEFTEIIEAGLEALKFSLVPPAIDQVIVADMEQSRLSDVKAAFVIGLNDDVLPKKFSEQGILTDEEREHLIESGFEIAPTNKTKMLDEDFIAYKAFTTPSDLLFISYPLADEEGKAKLPSPYVKRLREMFPKGKTLLFGNEITEMDPAEQIEVLVNKNAALTHVTYQLQAYKRNEPVHDLWWDCYNLLLESNRKEEVKRVLASLFFENKTESLTKDTVKELYGEVIQGSISKMETFNQCPFRFFASKGLRLDERQTFRLESLHVGILYHHALKYIGDRVIEKQLTWGKLTETQIETLVKEAMDMLAPKVQNEILLSTHRHRYFKQKLEHVLLRTVKVLDQQAGASKFIPVKLELSFGPDGELPPLELQLKNGMKMQLNGKIDRVDKAKSEKGVYLRVIDYKSSEHGLELGEVYYGIALQLLTYLDVLLEYAEKLVSAPAYPAGGHYFHVHNPFWKTSNPLEPEKIEQQIFKKFKMKGLVLSDSEVVRLMDQTLESGSSSIINAGINKNGSLSARSKAANEEEFHVLRKYVRHVFRETGNKIVDGKTDIAPFKTNDDKTACTYCPFKPVCLFDQSMKGNHYRYLPKLKDKEALGNIKEVVKDEHS